VLATVFTSGSTGPMLAAPKTAASLFGEAHALARSFGIGPGDRIVGSVPPVHIYGLLFTLLLPLACGAAFARETPHHAESIAHGVTSQGPRCS
jgi:acyl-coenzyme A synthetase/AMP-(fatty) acid ligase